MTTSSESSKGQSTYFIADSGAEMARLIEQDRDYTKAMGGLLAEQPDLSVIHRVLDAGCGPGGWALELAQAYPHMQVFGFDISSHMIDYANVQARASGLDNISFRVANALEPFDFPDDYFDLVNIRFMEGAIPITAWPGLMQEMVRTTRRGGIIRLTECEWGVSNSFAPEKFIGMISDALRLAGLVHSPDGRHHGSTPMLSRFLRDAGCMNVQEKPYAMDTSTGTEAHPGAYQNAAVVYPLARPFLVHLGVTTEQEFDQLYQQALAEMLEDEYCGIMYLLTAWGQKP